MKKEQAFFEQMAGTALPGWDVKLQPHMTPGQMDLASYTARIYLVDTSTGWTAAGALQPSGFAGLRAHFAALRLGIDKVTDMAGQALNQLGRDQPEPGSPDIGKSIELVAAALTETQTFKTVQASGLDGHWVYIGYRMHDASTICRPGFFRTGAPGFVAPEGLEHYVRQVVAHDLASTKSSVGQMLKRAGGAIISPEFK
jgi:hypothetical protein